MPTAGELGNVDKFAPDRAGSQLLGCLGAVSLRGPLASCTQPRGGGFHRSRAPRESCWEHCTTPRRLPRLPHHLYLTLEHAAETSRAAAAAADAGAGRGADAVARRALRGRCLSAPAQQRGDHGSQEEGR
eukprot:6007179-Prymnesium_polylepis.1